MTRTTTSAADDQRGFSQWWLLTAIIPALTAVGLLIYLAQPWRGSPDASMVGLGVLMAAWVVVPYVVAALLMLFLGRTDRLLRWLVVGYTIAMGVGGIIGYTSVVRSDSSTAVLAMLYFPVVQFAGLVAVVVVGGVITAIRSRRQHAVAPLSH